MKSILRLPLLLLFIIPLGCGVSLPFPGGTGSGGTLPLSEAEIIQGLRESIQVGAKNASVLANKQDAYFKNPRLFIPFPPEAQNAADKIRQLGLGELVDNFVLTLNRAGEQAAGKAAPIFADAVKKMSWEDARGILKGSDNAATEYFRRTTRSPLYDAFYPVVQNALKDVEATKYWGDITGTYNKIPFVQPVQTDLAHYATDKALDGLFVLLQDEEAKIRKNPADRITEILKRVFGYEGVI